MYLCILGFINSSLNLDSYSLNVESNPSVRVHLKIGETECLDLNFNSNEIFITRIETILNEQLKYKLNH